jgi:hypothetical protein
MVLPPYLPLAMRISFYPIEIKPLQSSTGPPRQRAGRPGR